MSLPKISIITITYNSEATIEQTILSVLNQAYENIEYIIIDGLSTDNTLGIIEKYKERIHTIVSEKDKGLYDALNKGLRLATGEYTGIIHSVWRFVLCR
jgi:glycosyltransferase involved in cell wall biosynthesis